MNRVRYTLLVALILAAAGCSTIHPTAQNDYYPTRPGNLADGETSGDISVALNASNDHVQRGGDLLLSVAIRNIGPNPVIFTQEPDTRLVWIYPDGKRDNMIGPIAEVGDLAGARLEPGQEIVRQSVVKTYYFNRKGITEFRAIVSAAGASEKGWTGRAISNGLGVRIE